MLITVPPDYGGGILRDYLRSSAHISRALLIRLKNRDGGILLNGVPVHVNAALRAGDVIALDAADTAGDENPYVEPVELPFDVLYEDSGVIAVNKPSGMPTHTSHDHRRDTLANAAAYYFSSRGQPFVFRAINRLDRDTSGVVVIAKDQYSAYRLGRFSVRAEREKEYFAVLRGIIDEAEAPRGVTYSRAGEGISPGASGAYRHAETDANSAVNSGGTIITGTIDAPIRRALPSIILREVAFEAEASPSVTRFVTEGQFKRGAFGTLTAVRAFPLTGRTHQLRVHFAYLCCPIAGDTLYGSYAADAMQPIARQALHCSAMTIESERGEPIRVTAPLPRDITALLEPTE